MRMRSIAVLLPLLLALLGACRDYKAQRHVANQD
jgi:hypothetical protein